MSHTQNEALTKMTYSAVTVPLSVKVLEYKFLEHYQTFSRLKIIQTIIE
jgi:hypothetical protein